MLFAKTADKVDGHRSNVANQTFDSPDSEESSPEPEVEKVTDTSMSVGGEGV